MIYIFWTCKDASEAEFIAEKLLEEKLIACANIFPEVTSIYKWNQSICKSKEIKVIFKTIPENFEQIQAKILKLGSYEVPEISQITIEKLNPAYAHWLTSECNPI